MNGDCSSRRALNSSAVMLMPLPFATTGPDLFGAFWDGEQARAAAQRPTARIRRTMLVAPSRRVTARSTTRTLERERLFRIPPRAPCRGQEKSTERRLDQAMDG